VARRRPVCPGDALFACQPIAVTIQQVGGSFILTCKPSSHQTITGYLIGAELSKRRQSVVRRGKRTTAVYRWLSRVPLRATEDALTVNWFSIEILNNKGERTYHNSFVTHLPVTAANVAELAACGRALEDRERNVQRFEDRRIQPRTQLRARQGNPCLGPGGSQFARLRLLYRVKAGRPGLARGRHRTRSGLPALRTFTDSPRLYRVSGMEQFAPLDRRRDPPS
jgi:hypothetical protein